MIFIIYKPSASRRLLPMPGDPKHTMQDKNHFIWFLNESNRSNSLELFGALDIILVELYFNSC